MRESAFCFTDCDDELHGEARSLRPASSSRQHASSRTENIKRVLRNTTRRILHADVGTLPGSRSITGVLSRVCLVAVGAIIALSLAAATPGNGAQNLASSRTPASDIDEQSAVLTSTTLLDDASRKSTTSQTPSTSKTPRSSTSSSSSTSSLTSPSSSTSSSTTRPATSAPSTSTKAPSTTTKAPPATTKPPVTTAPKPKDTGVIGNDVWTKLAQCESGNRNLSTGPYYGYFQFSSSTWRALGGTGLPSDHTYEEQKAMAIKLQARSGWGQWPACSRKIGVA